MRLAHSAALLLNEVDRFQGTVGRHDDIWFVRRNPVGSDPSLLKIELELRDELSLDDFLRQLDSVDREGW